MTRRQLLKWVASGVGITAFLTACTRIESNTSPSISSGDKQENGSGKFTLVSVSQPFGPSHSLPLGTK